MLECRLSAGLSLFVRFARSLRGIVWVSALFLCIPAQKAYDLREVREGSFLVFLNEKNLRVKAYYLVENQVYHVYRYYYNIKDLIVRAERWKRNKRLSYFVYEYDEEQKIKTKRFFVNEQLHSVSTYNKEGQEIKTELCDDNPDQP